LAFKAIETQTRQAEKETGRQKVRERERKQIAIVNEKIASCCKFPIELEICINMAMAGNGISHKRTIGHGQQKNKHMQSLSLPPFSFSSASLSMQLALWATKSGRGNFD